MERYYAQRVSDMRSSAAGRPAELTALDARITRLRARQRVGDPDMTADELEATIERAMAKRAELVGKPTPSVGAKVLSLLPKMAAAYRKQVEEGLEGDARAAAQARAIIGQLIGGTFKLVPEKGHLTAHFGLHRLPLLRAAGAQGLMVAGARYAQLLRPERRLCASVEFVHSPAMPARRMPVSRHVAVRPVKRRTAPRKRLHRSEESKGRARFALGSDCAAGAALHDQ